MSASIASQARPGGIHVPQVQRILPGPAGKLQQLAAAGALDQATPEALGLKDCGSCSTSVNPGLHDPCFQSTVWNNAKAYTAQQQAVNGPTGQLHTVQMAKELSLGKVPKMLVLLGSFQPSGAGSAFSKVKDPTGSIGAALHGSTLKQQPQLGPGCVLLLQHVSVFTPAAGTSYLAITANNVVKVWPAESAQDRIRNALHRPQPEQQQQQRRQQQQQQPSCASQQGSQQVATATLSGNANQFPQQQQQQQPLEGRGPTMTQQQRRHGSIYTQQQQQHPRQTQLPPPSPHLPALIDRSAGKAGAQGQQQQQSSSQWHQQQQQRMTPGDCSPAVGIGRGPTPQLNAAAADGGSSRMAGSATGYQQQHRVTGGSAALDAAAAGSMPPPAPRLQPSSFRGQLQKLQQPSQQLQHTVPGAGVPPRHPQEQLEQHGTWPGSSAPGSGGSCGSLSGGQADGSWQQQQQQEQQQQQGSQQSTPLPRRMGSQQVAPALSGGGGAVGPAGRRVEQQQQQQQQQWQQQAPALSLQPPGSQSIPPALLGQMPGRVARQQQQQRRPLPPAASAHRVDSNALASDGVDDVVAAIFGSQLGGAPAAHGEPPPPVAAPVAAAAVFGSQLAGTMRPPASYTAAATAQENTAWPQKQQQQLQNDAGRQPRSTGVIAAGTSSVSGQRPSNKRLKPSDGAVAAAVSGAVLPNPGSHGQLDTLSAGQQQQPKGHAYVSASDQGGLFGGLFGFQPPMQQQAQQRNALPGSGSTQNAAKTPAGGRTFISTLGRPPIKQTNLLDDLIGDDLDDFDI